MAGLDQTPSGMRTHIGFFGRTNSGKSSIINALVGQEVSIVSDVAGTTTDPVYKAMELSPIGPVLLIDTAGVDDEGELGSIRVRKTESVVGMCDLAVVIFSGEPDDTGYERELISKLEDAGIPTVTVLNKIDIYGDMAPAISARIGDTLSSRVAGDSFMSTQVSHRPIDIALVSAVTGEGIDELRRRITDCVSDIPEPTILHGLVKPGDLVMLVMPQDKQAPKGRLILPQVSTLRELLDTHACTMCVTPEQLELSLGMLDKPPGLIITDSQVFDYVYERKPEESKLTSFSVLYAGLKGDVDTYIAGAGAISGLKPGARILIAESCSHAPLEEDIGRVKIPKLIEKRVGGRIEVSVAAGKDFPDDLSGYDLIVQCGGCMVNRRQIMQRVRAALDQGVPITNYGICIAYLKGILDRITI